MFPPFTSERLLLGEPPSFLLDFWRFSSLALQRCVLLFFSLRAVCSLFGSMPCRPRVCADARVRLRALPLFGGLSLRRCVYECSVPFLARRCAYVCVCVCVRVVSLIFLSISEGFAASYSPCLALLRWYWQPVPV